MPKKTHEEIVSRMQETIDRQSDELKRMQYDLQKAVAISNALNSLESSLSSQAKDVSSQAKSLESIYSKIQDGTVPKQIYEQSIAAAKSLEDNIRQITEQKNSEFNALNAKNHELLEKISEMVPRSEYFAVQSQLAESISRAKHEEEMEKLRSETVGKEQYQRAEARVAELESMLDLSVPKSEFVDLMREVSSLTNGPPVSTDAQAEKQIANEVPQTPEILTS
jgi:hypothetical protein